MSNFGNIGMLPSISGSRTQQLEEAIREGKLKRNSKESGGISPGAKSFSSSSSSDEADEVEPIEIRQNPKIYVRQASELAKVAKAKQRVSIPVK